MLEDLGVAGIIDQVTGPRRSDAGASTGAYLALAALGRLVAPCSKLAFADWWAGTAAGRFTGIGAPALDHRRFWDAMHAAGLEDLGEISHRIALAIIGASGVDCSSVALDMTNFATFLDTGNEHAPIAQRGKAKQKRTDLRLVGLGLVVTRDSGIPLTWHAYPGDKPDVTQFPAMIDVLAGRHAAICAASGQEPAEMTVVFDAGQNSGANFAHLAGTDLRYVGSVPASDCAGLTKLPASARAVVDEDRFGGLTACDTRREVYGAGRRAILTHSPELHEKQARGSPAPPWPRQAASWTSWPPPWPAARPGGHATRSKPRSARSCTTPGRAASSPGSWPETPPKTTGSPGTSTPPPAPPWKKRSSASTS